MANNNNNNNINNIVTGVASAAILAGGLYMLTKGAQSIFGNAQPQHTNVQKKCSVVSTGDQCMEAVKVLLKNCQEKRYLGFDCEWVNQQPVSLLQLSDHTGYCVLIRLDRLDWFPSELQNLLENHTILKLGVGTHIDKTKLHNHYNLSVNGTLDLRFAQRQARLDGSSNSLSAMAKRHLHVQMDKSYELRTTDWNADVLTAKQLEYAALDATIAVDLYEFFLGNYGWGENDNVFVDRIWQD